jgi:cell fate (sporulation/competence/biofilm development) regulator YlbF (YheA/YmcA/DUF963 family)
VAKKNIVIDEVHGAHGEEMSDEDVAELKADTRDNVEVDEAEPQSETAETVDDDLPEGVTKPEVAEVAEPEVDPEVERLKKLDLYRPGLIETTEDALKSLKWHEQHKEEYVEKARREAQPAYDSKAEMEALVEELQTNPVAAIAKIANAMQDGDRQDITEMKETLFYSTHTDAADYKSEIVEIQKETGLGIQDSFDLAKGRDSGKVADKATLIEKRRATDRQVALRETPSGIRTAPVDAGKALNAAAAGEGSADEIVDRMIKILERENMGAKE